MKNSFRNVLISALVIMLLYQFIACSRPTLPDKIIVLDEEIVNDSPTVPENVPEGINYLYEFRFSERYDGRITGDFSLVFSDKASPISDTLFLLEKHHNEMHALKEYLYDGDGMVPHMHKRYWYTFKKGDLMIGTHYYEPDNVEYISYLWSDIEGVRTNKNVAVGSAEKELLYAYTDDLYYIDKDEALSETGLSAISIIGYDEGNLTELDENYDFDYAYLWQPFTSETNEIRDITFYIKGGKVVAIEVIEPYELRHVYGYDRDAGLQYTERKKEAAGAVSIIKVKQRHSTL